MSFRLSARLSSLVLGALLGLGPVAGVAVLGATTLAARTAQADEVLVGNKSSKVFHQADCRLAKKLKAENRETFASAAAAQQAGFHGCKVCKAGGVQPAKTHKKKAAAK